MQLYAISIYGYKQTISGIKTAHAAGYVWAENEYQAQLKADAYVASRYADYDSRDASVMLILNVSQPK